MMMLDTKPFMKVIKKLKKDVPEEMFKVGNWQMALAVQNVMVNIAVPPNEGVSIGGSRNMGRQKNQQEIRIESQLRRVFTFPRDGWTVVKAKDKSGDMMMKNGNKVMFFIDPKHQANKTSVHYIHKNAIGNNGQVKVEFDTHRMGNKLYSGKYVVTELVFKRYLKETQKHIGKTKSTWLKSLNHFTQQSGGYARWEAPSWITRHSSFGAAYAVYGVQNNESECKGVFGAGSNVPWADDLRAADKLKFALKLRQKEMDSGLAFRKLRGLIKKYSAA